MHEVSLVRSLIAQAIDAVNPVLPAGIRTVRVSVGPLTGVEPLLVKQAFDTLKTSAGLPECGLEIDEQTLEADCLNCASAFEVLNFDFRCPACRSSSVRITQGDEFRLLSIDVDNELADSLSEKLHRSEMSVVCPSNASG